MTQVVRFERTAPSGWSLNMYVLPLRNGGTLVHGATWLGEDTFERIEAHGEPSVLLAPNHYHHVSIPRFRARYPKALVVASPAAIPRLEKQGHKGLEPLTAIAELLPTGVSCLLPEGMRTGETWMDLGDGTLLVCDSFFHVNHPVSGFEGFMLRMLGVAPGLRIGATTKYLAVSDKRRYVPWVCATLERLAPKRLLGSHGDPYEDDHLKETLAELTRNHFGVRA